MGKAMQPAGDHFLPGADLSNDEDGNVSRGDFDDDAFKGLCRRTGKIDKKLVTGIR